MCEVKNKPPETDKPSSWTVVISDFIKTAITISSALFAVAVTFSTTLIGRLKDQTELWFLFWCWLSLLLSLIFGIAAHGLLVNYLRHGKNDRGTVFCANAAFFFLIIAAIAFLIFAKLSMTTDSDYASAITAVEKATADMPAISGNKDSKWNIQSLVWQETEKIWEIIVIERNLSLRFRVSISGVSGNTIKAEKF